MRPPHYNKGVSLDQLGKHEEATKTFGAAIKLDPKDQDAWIRLGLLLEQEGSYNGAIGSYSRALENVKGKEGKNKIRFELGRVQYDMRNLEAVFEQLAKIISSDKDNSKALQLKGKAELSRRNYKHAFESFSKEIKADPGNLLNKIWLAYAHFLFAEYRLTEEKIKYREEIYSIIGNLENLKRLLRNSKGNDDIRMYILYLLGNLYAKIADYDMAIERLKACIEIDGEPEIKALANSLLIKIWSNLVKPTWWSWWTKSPSSRGLRRFVFTIIVLMIPALLLGHPFAPELVNWISGGAKINWTVYLFLISLLIAILALPSIQTLKASDLEVGLKASSEAELVFSPAIIEEAIEGIEKAVSKLAKASTDVETLSSLAIRD